MRRIALPSLIAFIIVGAGGAAHAAEAIFEDGFEASGACGWSAVQPSPLPCASSIMGLLDASDPFLALLRVDGQNVQLFGTRDGDGMPTGELSLNVVDRW